MVGIFVYTGKYLISRLHNRHELGAILWRGFAHWFDCGLLFPSPRNFCFILQLFILIYRENLSERRILRQGATVGSYAVARTFQIRESIALMKVRYLKISIFFSCFLGFPFELNKQVQMYSRIGPLVIFCAPEFVFYPAYTLLPHGDQWNFWRHLSIALYDLWIGMCDENSYGCFLEF